MPPATHFIRTAAWVAPAMLLFGSACLSLAWVLLSLYLERQCSWMAVLGALQAGLLLRWGGMRPGAARGALAVAAVLALVAAANWGMAASHLGMAMGLNPWESALKLGPSHARTLFGLANQAVDLVWLGTAVLVAALFGR
ncbi:MAG TPA: hypothetical protein VEY92_04885 [Pseudoxanthomonas sp.]|nr:hypothetical protein [Pseudoxanthomonas sp.]